MEYVQQCSALAGVNYMEISLPKIEKDVFIETLKAVKHNKDTLPFAERFCKEYMYRNLVYSINEKYESKVSKLDCKSVNRLNCGRIVCYFHKEKASFHTFPSMLRPHSIAYVNGIVFKFHNRIYLNFEERKHEDGSESHRIFINYNHEDNVDLVNISKRVQQVLDVVMRLARRE
jgi:hypothetical protein